MTSPGSPGSSSSPTRNQLAASAAAALGSDATLRAIKVFHQIDEDGNGEIDFDEFVQVMSRKVNADYTSDQVKRAFRTFALGAPSGMVSLDAIKEALMNHCTEKLDKDQVEELVAQLETTADGLLNYEEYVEMMMR